LTGNRSAIYREPPKQDRRAGWRTHAGELSRLGGSPPYEADRPYAVGIKIRTEQLIGVVVDVDGEIARTRPGGALAARRRPIGDSGVETVVPAVADLVRELSAMDPAFEHLVGVGVEVSGQVDRNAGMVLRSHRMGWERPVPLAQLLEKATGYRTMVDHDVKILVQAEQLFGLGEGYRSFAVVTAGLGIGAGLVVDYEVRRGMSDTAGELGHMVLDPDGEPCSCGNRGCLETVAGTEAILRRLQAAGSTEVNDIERAADLARNGDEAAHQAFRVAGRALGFGLSWLVNWMNPGLVVVRADPALRASTVYEQAALDAYRAHAFYGSVGACEVVFMDHEHELGARSAGSMVLSLLGDRLG
jgi:predicted NBD/HSP70 family sugar kinase